jgi:hypothetical protein
MRLPWLLALLALSLSPARGEVTASDAAGFTLHHEHEFASLAKPVWRELIRPQDWWDDEHTYSGSGSNMRIAPQPGGCFCEKWDGNFVEHARVILSQPGQTLRLDGALGPLQEMAATGILTFALKEENARTTLTMTYRVTGSPSDKLDEMAPLVDKVLGEQFSWLTKRIETADPE